MILEKLLTAKVILATLPLIMLCLLYISYIYLYSRVSDYDRYKPVQHFRYAGIVLGVALRKNQPRPALTERLNQAIYLYRRGLIRVLVLSGGAGKADLSEAKVMARYLTQHGIPSSRLLLEEKSTNTKENLRFTSQLIDPAWEEVYLITHDFHMMRALHYAKQAEIKVAPVPVHSTQLWIPYHKTRECLALIKQRLIRT